MLKPMDMVRTEVQKKAHISNRKRCNDEPIRMRRKHLIPIMATVCAVMINVPKANALEQDKMEDEVAVFSHVGTGALQQEEMRAYLIMQKYSTLQTVKIELPEVTEIDMSPAERLISVSAEVELRNDDRTEEGPPAYNEVVKEVLYEVTAYTHTGERTATGTWPEVGTIAVNPKQIPYGTRLYVEGYGYGIAADTGAFRHSNKKQIDLFMDSERECVSWGRKRGVRVFILKDEA